MQGDGGARSGAPEPPPGGLTGVRLSGDHARFSSDAILQLFESIPVAISITTGPDHRFVYVNGHYRRALVPGSGDPIGRKMHDVFGGHVRRDIFELRDRALAEARIVTAMEEPVPPRSEEPSMYWDITYFPLLDEGGAATGILAFAVDVTEKVVARREAEHRADAEKARAEETALDRARLALALEATDLGLWEWNVETGEVVWSNRQKAIWGLEADRETSYELWRDSIHPDDRESVLGRIGRTLDPTSGGDQRMEHRIVRPSGAIRWIASRGRMIYDDKSGRPLRLIGTVLDITNRKTADAKLREALAAKEILLKEVNHRVKNSLQLVSAMLALQSARSDDARLKALILEAQTRVQVVASVHERLYRSADMQSVDLDVFLKSLCQDVERAVLQETDAITVEVRTEPMTIGNDRAVPIALILNELLTNAIKYAYPLRNGAVEVTLRNLPEGMGCLTVADSGVGLSPDFADRRDAAFGFRIIEGLARQIGGEVEVADRSPGASFVIRFKTGAG